MAWMFNRIRAGDLTGDEQEASTGFLEAIAAAAESAQGALESSEQLMDSLRITAGAARPVARVAGRDDTANAKLMAAIDQFVGWGRDARRNAVTPRTTIIKSCFLRR